MRKPPSLRCCAVLALVCLAATEQCVAAHDIEFVAEHLPEVSMGNRYASLPLWGLAGESRDLPVVTMQGAWSRTESGGLSIQGPMFSLGISHKLTGAWRWGAFGFYDPLKLQATHDERPLQTLFSPETPIQRPVAARFSNMDGRSTDYGAGVFIAHAQHSAWLGEYEWTVGVLWQWIELRHDRLDYEILEGPQRGVTGQIDFDTDYTHVAPFAGVQLPRTTGRWTISPHALLVVPLPRRALVGHITGPGFDLRGDAEQTVGNHFGDPSVTVGVSFSFQPLHLSIDLGAFATQAVLERKIHPGIERNYLLSVAWQY